MTANQAQLDDDIADQLLQLAGAASDQPDVETSDYDWHVPRRFVPSELARLNGFAEGVAQRMSVSLTRLLQAETKMVAAPMTQQYVAGVIEGVSEAGDCWISLALAGGRPAGLIRLPSASAKSWAAKTLGGSSGDQADGDLSAVEGELVLDIVSAMVEDLSAASEPAGGPVFEHSGRLGQGRPELADCGTDDYCNFSFGAEGSDDAGDVSVVILSEVMASVARGGAVDKAAKSAEAIREDLVGHLEQLIVVTTACLGRAEVAIGDVLALEAGDVLVTETMVGEPIELLLAGEVMLSGMPVQSSGRYALKITAAGPDAARAATGPPA